jgi:hypothetical protein
LLLTLRATAGERAHEVVRVHRAECLVRRLAELADDEATSRLGDAQELAQRGIRIGDVAQTEAHRHDVEGLVGEGQVHRVGRGEAEVRTALVAHAQHPQREVGGHDVDTGVGRTARCSCPVPAAMSSTTCPGTASQAATTARGARGGPGPARARRWSRRTCSRRHRTSRRRRGGSLSREARLMRAILPPRAPRVPTSTNRSPQVHPTHAPASPHRPIGHRRYTPPAACTRTGDVSCCAMTSLPAGDRPSDPVASAAPPRLAHRAPAPSSSARRCSHCCPPAALATCARGCDAATV